MKRFFSGLRVRKDALEKAAEALNIPQERIDEQRRRTENIIIPGTRVSNESETSGVKRRTRGRKPNLQTDSTPTPTPKANRRGRAPSAATNVSDSTCSIVEPVSRNLRPRSTKNKVYVELLDGNEEEETPVARTSKRTSQHNSKNCAQTSHQHVRHQTIDANSASYAHQNMIPLANIVTQNIIDGRQNQHYQQQANVQHHHQQQQQVHQHQQPQAQLFNVNSIASIPLSVRILVLLFLI